MIKGSISDNRHLVIVLASDVSSRDGPGWQLHEVISDELIFVLEIFRHDDLKKIEFFSYDPINVPFDALERLIDDFNTTGGRDFIVD